MNVILGPLFDVVLVALKFYEFIVIAAVIMSWLFHFNIINYSNQFVRIIADMVFKLTEPILSRIRNFMPNLGGIDISPIILLLLVFFLQRVVLQIAARVM